MDFRKLLNVASSGQKEKEQQLKNKKGGYSTQFSSAKDAKKSSNGVDEEKRKRLDAIRARVEAQNKGSSSAKSTPKPKENIMDFTSTGLSENDTRRKKLNPVQMEKIRREFEEKRKRLKECPVGSETTSTFKSVDNTDSKRKSTGSSSSSNKMYKSKAIIYEKGDDKDEQYHDLDKPLESVVTPKSIAKSNAYKDSIRNQEKHKDSHRHKHKHKSSDKHRDKHSDKSSSKHRIKSSSDLHKHSKESEKKLPTKSPATEKHKEIKKPKLKKRKPPPGPPPLSFSELLFMAQTNQKPKEDGAPEKPKKPEKKEPNRPMTKEEKERYARTQTPEYQRWIKKGGPAPEFFEARNKRRPKYNPGESDEEEEVAEPVLLKSLHKNAQVSNGATESSVQKPQQLDRSKMPERRPYIPERKSSGLGIKPGNCVDSHLAKNGSQAKLSKGDIEKSKDVVRDKQKQQARPSHSVASDNVGSKIKAKPSAQTQPQESHWDRIYSHIKKNQPQNGRQKKPHVIESDEEYASDLDGFIEEDDEDLDDFIDDSEAKDYSSHIRDIFGYDKRKYRHIDEDDLSDMESGFAQQMKEEIHSSKVGQKEDLEDMRMEAEENKRKMLLKKKAKKMKK